MSGAGSEAPVRIVVVDDQRLCRECVRLLIESIDRQLEVAEAANIDDIDAILAGSERPTVVLYNLVITDEHSIEFVSRLAGSIGSAPLVVMCDAKDGELVRGCIERGAKAYISSATPGPMLVSILRLVIAGGIYAPADLLFEASPSMARPRSGGDSDGRREGAIARNFPNLTRRQRDVLVLLSRGLSNREIADSLEMCENTVKAHVKQVMRKLEAENRTQAALMADRLVG